MMGWNIRINQIKKNIGSLYVYISQNFINKFRNISLVKNTQIQVPSLIHLFLVQIILVILIFRVIFLEIGFTFYLLLLLIFVLLTFSVLMIWGSKFKALMRKDKLAIIKRKNTRYLNIFNSSPIGIGLINSSYEYIDVNDTLCKMLGYEKNELMSMNFVDITHPDDITSSKKLVKKLFSRELSQIRFEKRYIKKNGQYLWVDLTTKIVRDSLGLPEYCISMVEDISNRKRIEESLKASEERYRTLIEYSPIGVVLQVKDRIVYVNQVGANILGADSDLELVGKPIMQYVHKDYRELTQEMIKDMFETKQKAGASIQKFIRVDGGIVDVEVVAVPMEINNDIAIQIVFKDITDRSVYEKSLLLNKRALETINEGILITDPLQVDNPTIYCNPAFTEITGYSERDLLGRNLRILSGIRTSQKELDRIRAAIKNQESYFGKVVNYKKNGETFLNKLTIKPIFNEKGKITNWLGVVVDITEQKNNELELIKAKEKAEETQKVKEELLANISHELRTPLNVIMGMSELFIESGLTKEQLEYLNAMKLSADNLLIIIGDILDLSKIDANGIKFENVCFDFKKEVTSIIEIFKYSATEKGVVLEYNIDSEIPNYLVGDAFRLGQIIKNLFGNAIKFTDKGSVSLEVAMIGVDDDFVNLKFDVRDTGIGIRKDRLKKIFDTFTQASTDTDRKFGGTGLGLSIVKRLVKLFGGSISVESEVGKGSKFSFIIKFKKANKSEINKYLKNEIAEKVDQRDLEGYRLLMVDDNSMNRLIIKKLLGNKFGATVDTASNGSIALELVDKNEYDLILMDIQMPGLSGNQTVEKIRLHKNSKVRNVPIFALTAHGSEYERVKAIKSGMDDYIVKPFEPDSLLQKVLEAVSCKN